MSLFGGLFSKKKELVGKDIDVLFKTASVDREPVIVLADRFKAVSDLVHFEPPVFHLKNNLTRDEVMNQLRGKNLQVQIPYELTLYAGTTRLLGLGLVKGMHSLKFQVPDSLIQEESRGAFRVNNFSEMPSVTFTSDQVNIIKARLVDISMTGAGIRLDPRWSMNGVKLEPRASIIIDIRLTKELRVSATAIVRYVKNHKMGIQFEELQRGVKERLLKFVVERRREAQRALMRLQQRMANLTVSENVQPVTEPVGKPTGKPTALVVGVDRQLIDFFGAILMRKFNLLFATPSLADIRNHLELKPNLCLIELRPDNSEQAARMKKASAMLPPGCVLMYYGENLHDDFRKRFLAGGSFPDDIFLEMQEGNKLLTFKRIERFYEQRAPK